MQHGASALCWLVLSQLNVAKVMSEEGTLTEKTPQLTGLWASLCYIFLIETAQLTVGSVSPGQVVLGSTKLRVSKAAFPHGLCLNSCPDSLSVSCDLSVSCQLKHTASPQSALSQRCVGRGKGGNELSTGSHPLLPTLQPRTLVVSLPSPPP